MVINTSGFSKILQLFHTDVFDVHRYIKTQDEDGATVNQLSPVPSLSGIKCRISYASEDDSKNLSDGANLQYQTVDIFTSPNMDIRKGDYIVATRIGTGGTVLATYNGLANLPSFYDNHIKITVVIEGKA